jgi:hypothetical protein
MNIKGGRALRDYNLAIYTQVKPNAKQYTQILNSGILDIVARQKRKKTFNCLSRVSKSTADVILRLSDE